MEKKKVEFPGLVECLYSILSVLAVVALLSLTLLFGSCRTKYVAVPEYHTEYVYKTDSFISKDSIMCHDSIYVEKKGDTITTVKTKYIYRDRWREILKTDTIIKTDSIRVPYPVEGKVPFWEKAKIASLGAVGMLVLAILAIAVWLLRKRLLRKLLPPS